MDLQCLTKLGLYCACLLLLAPPLLGLSCPLSERHRHQGPSCAPHPSRLFREALKMNKCAPFKMRPASRSSFEGSQNVAKTKTSSWRGARRTSSIYSFFDRARSCCSCIIYSVITTTVPYSTVHSFSRFSRKFILKKILESDGILQRLCFRFYFQITKRQIKKDLLHSVEIFPK